MQLAAEAVLEETNPSTSTTTTSAISVTSTSAIATSDTSTTLHMAMGSHLLSFGRGAKVLLTGPPGVGKSTLLRSVIDKQTCSVGGVLCLESRVDGRRLGFSAILSNGKTKMFMKKKSKDVIRDVEDKLVGRYVVDVKTINDFVAPELQRCLDKLPGFIYIDEIGLAQAYSPIFFQNVRNLFMADCNILATILFKDEMWSLEYKYNPQSWLIPVTVENRAELTAVIHALINNFYIFEQMTESQQKKTRQLFFELISSGRFVSAKKLFTNAIVYVVKSNIELTDTEESGETIYEVDGTTDTHTLRRNLATGKFICDCDLSNGTGSFSSLTGGQTCSHELSILISES
jgi:nucleoside-triphosphatase